LEWEVSGDYTEWPMQTLSALVRKYVELAIRDRDAYLQSGKEGKKKRTAQGRSKDADETPVDSDDEEAEATEDEEPEDDDDDRAQVSLPVRPKKQGRRK
jgi:hypothetical protein